jgi:hypothetical protein
LQRFRQVYDSSLAIGLFTWNSIGIIDVPSMLAITQEAWLRNPTTVINQDSGWHPWFRVSGGAAAPRSPITAVARNPNHLDLFVTGTDGRTYSTWWDANGGERLRSESTNEIRSHPL